MTILKEDNLKQIVRLLSNLSTQIKCHNKISFTDINISAEDFYKGLFNLVYNSDFKNINIEENKNYPAIDLGDENKSWAIQVTSIANSTKIKKTISKFLKNNFYNKYTRLTFFIITQKQKTYRAKFDTESKFEFDPKKDILDIANLMEDIKKLFPDQVGKIKDYLNKEIGYFSSRQKNSLNKEVITIIDLIALLSKEGDVVKDDNDDDPDPEHKIYKRFSDYSDFLTSEIKDYIPLYKHKKNEAEKIIGIDLVVTKKISRYLKSFSDGVLHQKNNDPRKALNYLVKFFDKKMSQNKKKYDMGAIRYYLLDQVIKCNVFPNEND
jgi:hypothetical protein